MVEPLMAVVISMTWIGVMMLHLLRFGGSNLSELVIVMVNGLKLWTFHSWVIPARMQRVKVLLHQLVQQLKVVLRDWQCVDLWEILFGFFENANTIQ